MTNLPKQVKDETGNRYGRLTVVAFHDTVAQHRGRAARWLCRCDCGNSALVLGTLLRVGNTTSCGCFSSELTTARNHRHGAASRGRKTVEYTAWRNMIARCYSQTATQFHFYGGRGITVCDRWRYGEGGVSGFLCFLSDMGPKPSKKMSIDRINNDGNYEPGNVRWATQKIQVRNSRRVKPFTVGRAVLSMVEASESAGLPYGRVRSRKRHGWSDADTLGKAKAEPSTIVVNGRTMTLAEAGRISPIGISGIRRRLRLGWSPEDAVFTPRQKTGPKARRA